MENTIEIDTSKVENMIEELTKNINDYENNVDSLYEEIKLLKDAWVGPDADYFISHKLDDKIKFLEMAMVLKEYRDCLSSISKKMDECNYIA